jgi:hypothetical protein
VSGAQKSAKHRLMTAAQAEEHHADESGPDYEELDRRRESLRDARSMGRGTEAAPRSRALVPDVCLRPIERRRVSLPS